MALTDKIIAIANGFRVSRETDKKFSLDEMASMASEKVGGCVVSGIYMAKITPAEDMSSLQVTHNLGTTDILIALCQAETLGDVVPSFGGALGKFWTKTDIPNNRNGVGNSTYSLYNTSNAYATLGTPSSVSYWDEVVDENTFRFKQAGNAAAKYIAGVTYTVIIMAASAFHVTEV